MGTKEEVQRYNEEQAQIKAQIERKHKKTTEELYAEREKRARDATELRVPDRAPLSVNFDPARFTDIPRSAAYYDPIGYKRAVRQLTVAFEPDMSNAGLPTSGKALEILGVTNRLWPGGPLPPNYEYQVVETEFLHEDEYDLFLTDPTDFMIRYYWPRMYKSLAPLSKLPALGVVPSGFEAVMMRFTRPEFQKAAKAVAEAGKEMRAFRETIGDSYGELAYLGFPPFSSSALGVSAAPRSIRSPAPCAA